MPHHHHHRLLQTNSQNNLTFLKSNYKFKRRNMLTMRALPVPTTTEARTPNQLAATLSKTSAAEAAKAAAVPVTSSTPATSSETTTTTNSSHKCRTILSLFIAIAWNIVQESANWFLQQAGRIDRLAIPDDAGHDVNTAPLRHRCTRIAGTADDANDKVSTAREQQQQQQQPQPQPHQQQLGNDYLASSSQPCTRTTSGPGQQHHQLQLHSGQPLMTLLIGLLLLNISLAAAGTCWQTHLGSGKCNQIFSTNITKTECCGASQTFSYTDRELSSVEYFFATAIGGGVECAPCMENCKSFKCGPNKKCVKRKGRPKCVCAPECGAALRRKQQQEQQEQQQQQQQQQQQKHWGIKTQRGSRSLSSEITNINLDINGAKRQRKHSDIADNQRKSEQGNSMPMPMPMPQRQSQKKALGETKHRRLLIIDSSSSSGSQSKTNNGRVEMRGYETRRRHRNNHGKHLTRSMMTGANDSTPAHQTTQSRHKLANANEPANDINRQQQQQQQPRRRNNKKHNKDQRIRIVAGTSAAAATTTSSTTTTLLTVNTTMSVSGSGPHRRRLYQNEHGSEMAASSAQSQSHSHLANADDLAFLSGIYEPVVLQQQQQHSNPVCGSDGRTYNTECQLRKRACRSNNAQLEVAYRGHCKTSCHGVQCLNGLMCVEDQYMMPHCISCNIECPRHNGNRRDNDDGDDDDDELDLDGYGYDGDYDEERAVCGVDGKTYRSACDINRMICKIGRSIAVAYPGPCRADRVSCADIKCGPKDTCLVDLQTQMPRCVSCRYKCSRKRQQQSGQVQVDKICGFNNHTYNSWCEMRKDSCATGYFIGVKAQGSC